MSGVFRIGIRFLNRSNSASGSLLDARVTSALVVPACNISGKTLRGSKLSKPKPFPYQEKRYTAFQACKDVLFKNTTSRFDENTKVKELGVLSLV